MTLAFLLTSLVIVATPGTGALYAIAAGLTRGARAGVLAAFAGTLGTIPHLVAAVTGLAALLHASGIAFAVLKYAGVAYLLYMAWATWRDHGALSVDEGDAGERSVWGVLGAGITLNLLNPKLTIFFFAFLPQFVPAGDGAVPAMLGLSAVFMAMTFVVFAVYGVFAAAVRDQVLRRPRVLDGMRKAFAATFAALAGRLALESR
jgi:threonine/homoserine/homoserine lactone efflux protein